MSEIKCVIFDFGGVIGMPQVEAEVDQMVSLTGMPKDVLVDKYFGERNPYDEGRIDSRTYWERITVGYDVELSEDIMEELVLADSRSWTVLNEETYHFIHCCKEIFGQVALLSNINHGVLDYVKRTYEWLDVFDYTFYSCDLLCLKPGIKIYEHVLEGMNLKGDECIFIDDSLDNIKGAEAVGINGVHFINNGQVEKEVLAYQTDEVEC